MVISDRTTYGVSQEMFRSLQSSVGPIFESADSWVAIDQRCRQSDIQVLVVDDLDPLWKHLGNLERERSPLFQNQYYAVLACGAIAKP